MVSPTTLLMGQPCHLKRTPQAPNGPSPCFPRAMLALGGEGSRPARHAGYSWCAPRPLTALDRLLVPTSQAPPAVGGVVLVAIGQTGGASAPVHEHRVEGLCFCPSARQYRAEGMLCSKLTVLLCSCDAMQLAFYVVVLMALYDAMPQAPCHIVQLTLRAAVQQAHSHAAGTLSCCAAGSLSCTATHTLSHGAASTLSPFGVGSLSHSAASSL